MLAPLVPYIAIALSIMHFVLAAGVTLHVLAHNRNPGSAVAWIGLAWLSPVVGSVLYLFLGINRVQRRARSAGAVRARPGGGRAGAAACRLCDHLAAPGTCGAPDQPPVTSSRATPSPCWPTATRPIRR